MLITFTGEDYAVDPEAEPGMIVVESSAEPEGLSLAYSEGEDDTTVPGGPRWEIPLSDFVPYRLFILGYPPAEMAFDEWYIALERQGDDMLIQWVTAHGMDGPRLRMKFPAASVR